MGFYISTKSTPIQRALGQGTGDLPSEVNSKTTLNHNQGQDKGKVRQRQIQSQYRQEREADIELVWQDRWKEK